jgi:hypothetical protein
MAEGIKDTDASEAAYQLTVRWGGYSRLSGITQVLRSGRRESWRNDIPRTQPTLAGFEDRRVLSYLPGLSVWVLKQQGSLGGFEKLMPNEVEILLISIHLMLFPLCT